MAASSRAVASEKSGEGSRNDSLKLAHPLDPLFAPKSIAVIGATETTGTVGLALIENLKNFPGKVFPVNPKRSTVLGLRAWPSVRELPVRSDLAVIATPNGTVAALVAECAACRIPAAIVISAGFKECGADGASLEKQLLAEAQRANMRLLGPNCLGAMVPHAKLNATFASTMARPGTVAFLSQSGALCTAVLDWSLRENVGFSAFVSVGSMLDVSWGDLIYYFGDDPHTKSIVIYMESVGEARAFLSSAREVALTKPIIVIKVGRTEAAAKAAASHTGSLTGSDDVLDAAFRRVGVLRVNAIEELFDMAEVLGKQPRPKGPRLSIVTNAGGPGVLATDMLITSGGQLAELSPETFAAFSALLPPHWSRNNPVDILGDANPERYQRAVEIAAKDPGSDGLLVILTPQAMTDPTATAAALKSFAKLDGKPILASWMGGPEVNPGCDVLNAANIPTFNYPDTAARAFVYMWRYSSNLRSLYETPALALDSSDAALNRRTASKLIQRVRKRRRTLLTEYESKQILQSYGIPTVETHLAKTEDEAVALARQVGFPVVLKLHSETITHKTDVGGVQLNLANAKAVRRAWRGIETAVLERKGSGHFLGATVQPMVAREGYELIFGSSIDPQFGPVLLFGAGGQLVETFKDRALALPPLNATLARRAMEQTRIYQALQGVRGRQPVDLAGLEKLLVRFSQLVAEQPWIKEIDINPLLVSPERLIALDARVVLHDPSCKEEALPRPAIRPYPTQYIARRRLKNGTTVTIRPIRPEDEPLLVKFHETLSEQTVYHRYFTSLPLAQRIQHERLTRICFIDYDREMALVAERRHPHSGQLEIIGVGRLSKWHGVNEAEFAIVVSDRHHDQGLGSELLRSLVQIGRDEKLERINGIVLADNSAMRRVCRKAGFEIKLAEASECRVELVL